MSLALVEHFLDRVLVEAQIVGDLEEVDLLCGADVVVDLNDCNQALEQRGGLDPVFSEASEDDVLEPLVV